MTVLPMTLTDRAALRIGQILSTEPGKTALRLAVNGGGCSGFQYEFSLVSARAEDDIAIEKNGATLLVDEISAQYVQGSELDFVDDLMGAFFRVNNPNATASCGCGTSFSV
ncbi:MAG: iron-sulfur cluster insertion protein ErpA [Pseudomonadota bacterium]